MRISDFHSCTSLCTIVTTRGTYLSMQRYDIKFTMELFRLVGVFLVKVGRIIITVISNAVIINIFSVKMMMDAFL